ncbi:hypothetical protein E6P09_09600 [Haloferax mediterranei ATCC 33500]|uniref:Uncharacterized protein n=1 Tax=Haloferax mediterranei (strain ATCC 33500 / DSM 1411 / JCM 8866 / NBRC 14739 / NCIMB 2177 / R-4) TaxID=523841 RepID=I3R469_HALMT|nr:hypothetical protein [Haloferax mediterranei]AFK19029.1 hypothetical protein HFX_1318 [Haloferax mediterranei ATCC 33500]AHZ21611.1 hypothetical protein BM92_02595 [Haloferax mediterranei ATCC 33500]EMA03706.1 hypothetical protein C439_03915 [Haloferax mediterranei ATCC 33500]MDX5989123.1 hypothetical protein [Haloferax mediterranei ATCC 33500]QCQ75505.1 hypothetical protein E6P09_09600 [Haloferax mediterranei ATCC 33500]
MLKNIATAGVGLSIMGTASADNDVAAREGTGGFTMDLSGSEMKRPEEMREIAKNTADKHNTDASSIVPGTDDGGFGTMNQNPDLSGCDEIGGWNNSYYITDDVSNVKYAKVDNLVMLYRAYEPEPNGRWTYAVWLWSGGTPLDKPYSPGGIDWMTNKIDVLSQFDVLKFDPAVREKKHGKNVSFGITVGTGSDATPTVGISGSSDVYEGYVTTVDADVDDAGHVKTKFKGSPYDGAQKATSLNAAIAIRGDRKLGFDTELPDSDFNWEVHGYYGV